jgi:hypothetical protein
MEKVSLSVGMFVTVRYMSRGAVLQKPDGGEPIVVPIVGEAPLWELRHDIKLVIASLTGTIVDCRDDYIIMQSFSQKKWAAILRSSIRAVDVISDHTKNGRA